MGAAGSACRVSSGVDEIDGWADASPKRLDQTFLISLSLVRFLFYPGACTQTLLAAGLPNCCCFPPTLSVSVSS